MLIAVCLKLFLQFKNVPHFLALRFQIFYILRGGLANNGHSFHYLQPVSFESDNLARIVGQQSKFVPPQVSQNLRSDTVIPQVAGKAQRLVSLHGIQPLVLQRISSNLIMKSDTAPLLPHIEKYPTTFVGNSLHGEVYLLAAVAAQ